MKPYGKKPKSHIPIFTTKNTKSTKKKSPVGLLQTFVLFVLSVVKILRGNHANPWHPLSFEEKRGNGVKPHAKIRLV
jgi:hypothetical protein